MLKDMRLTMKSEELELLREKNRKGGSNPLVIMILFVAMIAGLISLGSQSSRRNYSPEKQNVIGSFFSKP